MWRRKRRDEDLARILCMMYLVAPSSKRKKTMTPADFMPRYNEDQKEVELDEQGAYLIETFRIPESALSEKVTRKGGT